jgi:hypothetical protein
MKKRIVMIGSCPTSPLDFTRGYAGHSRLSHGSADADPMARRGVDYPLRAITHK